MLLLDCSTAIIGKKCFNCFYWGVGEGGSVRYLRSILTVSSESILTVSSGVGRGERGNDH